MTATARRGAGPDRPGTVAPLLAPASRRRRGRLEWQLLRWQARLDTAWADRVVPLAAALLLFTVWTAMALTRVDRLDAGGPLARSVQSVWLLSTNHAPQTTIGGAGNLLADRFPALLVPVGLAARVLPVTTLLISMQSAALALGVYPLWRLARRAANLGIGGASALVAAYAVCPAIADLDLADFNPATMALTPLLAAAYFAEQRRWRAFTFAAVVAVLWSSELALVVAAMGAVLLFEREGRAGRRTLLLGVGWCVFALLFIQAPLGSTGLVAPGAFDAYGSNGFDVLIAMVRNPFRPLGDVLTEANLSQVVWVLGPLLFLPVLAFRKLIPALPLQALYFVADVPVTGALGGARMVPLVAFSFVAAPFALARFGHPRLDRVPVDRRFLGLLLVAALAGAALTSPLSPYERPWRASSPFEEDRRVALARIPPDVPVRVPAALAPRVAERAGVYVLEDEFEPRSDGAPPAPAAAALVDGVDALVLDTALFGLDDEAAATLSRSLARLGFVEVRRSGTLRVYLPFTDAGRDAGG